MKNLKENLKKTVMTVMAVMMILNAGFRNAYAEEESVPQQAEQEVLDQPGEEEAVLQSEEETPIVEETEEVIESEELNEELAEEAEEIAEEANEELNEDASWKSYTLYNYISINEGQSYISLNTQESGIRTRKSAEQFHKENGNRRYDLSENEYQIDGYDLTSLVITTAGYSFVEQSMAKEGQPYFIARLDRVEAVAAARFRYSDSVEGIESFTSLGTDQITFHRNWYLTLVTPMTSNRLLTGVRLGDGKNGNGDGRYYGLSYTEDFTAIDSRLIPFGTKLNRDQYSIEDYDFTNVTLKYKGETYAYRPNGPVAGDGENFRYYTVSFMKLDKLNKSTYAGGYLTENWPAWPFINNNSGSDGYPYQAGYYHRDYQATLMVGDAPAAIGEEEVITEETVPAAEEVKEEIAVEEIADEETADNTEEETVSIEEEAATENTVKEDTKAAETVKEEASAKEDTVINNTVKEEAVKEETAESIIEEASAEETVKEDTVQNIAVNAAAESNKEESAPVQEASAEANAPEVLDIRDEIVPLASVAEAYVEENGSWALMNLVLALISVLTMSRKQASRLLGIVPAVLALLCFLLTEDMGNAMALTDSYTLMMAVFPLASLLIAWIARDRKEENNNNNGSCPVASPVN